MEKTAHANSVQIMALLAGAIQSLWIWPLVSSYFTNHDFFRNHKGYKAEVKD